MLIGKDKHTAFFQLMPEEMGACLPVKPSHFGLEATGGCSGSDLQPARISIDITMALPISFIFLECIRMEKFAFYDFAVLFPDAIDGRTGAWSFTDQ